ncbi:Peptidyl-tRNA hydrolase PTH2, variant 2 [Balamuthia mandrillaris]
MKEAANKKMAEEELEEDFMLAQALALSMEEANAAGSASAAALTSSTTTNAASETNSNNTSTPAWSSSASALPPLSSSQATNNQQEIADFFLKLLPSALSAVTQQQQQAQPPQEGAKLVLCVRTDLKMTTGKIAAQCSHATLGLYKYGKKHHKELIRLWEAGATPKIALRIRNEEEMLASYPLSFCCVSLFSCCSLLLTFLAHSECLCHKQDGIASSSFVIGTANTHCVGCWQNSGGTRHQNGSCHSG